MMVLLENCILIVIGKILGLLIYSNNGDACFTFSKLVLFSPQADGTVIDVTDWVYLKLKTFSANNMNIHNLMVCYGLTLYRPV